MANSITTPMLDLQNIYPFHIVNDDNNLYTLYFDANLRSELFEDFDKESSGCSWVDISELFLETYLPKLLGRFQYDPSYELFSIQGSFADIKRFTLEFRLFFYNDDLLSEIIEKI